MSERTEQRTVNRRPIMYEISYLHRYLKSKCYHGIEVCLNSTQILTTHLPKVLEIGTLLLLQLDDGFDCEDDHNDKSDELADQDVSPHSTQVTVDPQRFEILPDDGGAHLGELNAHAEEGEEVDVGVVQR